MIWDHQHKIIEYEMLMEYPYNIFLPNNPITIGYHPYLHCYHKPHFRLYRLNLQNHHPSTILQTHSGTTMEIHSLSDQIRKRRGIFLARYKCLIWTHLTKSSPLTDSIDKSWLSSVNPLSINTNLSLYISTGNIVPHLTNGCMNTVSAMLTGWWPLNNAWISLPSN